ncbi:hypothetical protein V7x_12720 [Crateriforma conspicua]|uniref:Bacterial extracellular solute-binding protein n=2 Tax=Planctomycetaceae TaxID=126 RepID=A0A5C6FXF0_9PLAN|nr:hypothetical protein V7x_12720 [Crateriforma conspicua]
MDGRCFTRRFAFVAGVFVAAPLPRLVPYVVLIPLFQNSESFVMPNRSNARRRPESCVSRRAFVTGGLGLGAVAVTGCSEPDETSSGTASSVRTDVPLRVVWVGHDDPSEVLQRNWGAVAEVPLKVQWVRRDEQSITELGPTVLAASRRADVLVVPLLCVADLYAGDLISEIQDAWQANLNESLGPVLTSLRVGAASYAASDFAVPLGSDVPVLMVDVATDPIENWDAFSDYASQHANRVAEPIGRGQCGESYLRRIAGTVEANWLFDRETFQPTIDSDVCTAALESMKAAAQHYAKPTLTAREIGMAIAEGTLDGGIGVLPASAGDTSSLDLRPLPSTVSDLMQSDGDQTVSSDVGPTLLSPWTSLGILPKSCRQSKSAKQFLQWLAGGEGIGSVRNQLAGLDVTRIANSIDGGESLPDPYQQIRRDQLSSAIVRPTTQLIQGCAYYDALDASIHACVAGDTKPAQALATVAATWSALTEAIGVEKQIRAWRRSQGRRI